MRQHGNSGKAAFVLFCAAAFWLLASPVSEARADYYQAKHWFESQSPSSRVALQNALFWSGEYFGPIDAQFGSQTYASLISFQRRSGAAPTGVLNRSDRAALHDEARRIRQLLYYHSRRTGGTPATGYRSPGYALATPTLILP